MIRRLPKLFPLALVAVLVMLTAWLDLITRWNNNHYAIDKSQPEYTAEEVKATRFSPAGLLQDRMQANTMWAYPDSNDIHFTKPDIEIYQNGILTYKIVGTEGYFNHAKNTAWFAKSVALNKLETAEQAAVNVKTSNMLVNFNTQVASGKAPVSILYQGSVASATGFKFDQKNGTLNLLSKAKIVYEKP